jgi:hypothetical protein
LKVDFLQDYKKERAACRAFPDEAAQGEQRRFALDRYQDSFRLYLPLVEPVPPL